MQASTLNQPADFRSRPSGGHNCPLSTLPKRCNTIVCCLAPPPRPRTPRHGPAAHRIPSGYTRAAHCEEAGLGTQQRQQGRRVSTPERMPTT